MFYLKNLSENVSMIEIKNILKNPNIFTWIEKLESF